jgi:hypothetical protein
MDKNCLNCKFSRSIDPPNNTQWGCVRYPPALVPVSRLNPLTRETETQLMATFPPITKEIWCGEYVVAIVFSESTKARGNA